MIMLSACAVRPNQQIIWNLPATGTEVMDVNPRSCYAHDVDGRTLPTISGLGYVARDQLPIHLYQATPSWHSFVQLLMQSGWRGNFNNYVDLLGRSTENDDQLLSLIQSFADHEIQCLIDQGHRIEELLNAIHPHQRVGRRIDVLGEGGWQRSNDPLRLRLEEWEAHRENIRLVARLYQTAIDRVTLRISQSETANDTVEITDEGKSNPESIPIRAERAISDTNVRLSAVPVIAANPEICAVFLPINCVD